MQVKILGCGNSVGVPVIGCDCDICISCDLKDKRTRSSAFLQTSKSKVLIDASPDIRLQSIKHGISELDAVFLTHIHFDHVCGVHDLPAFCATKNFDDPVLPIYTDSFTALELKKIAAYLFSSKKVGSAQWKRRYLDLKIVEYYKTFDVAGESFFIFPQEHGNINCSGIIVNESFAYCTDVRIIPDQMVKKMRSLNLDLLVIECFTHKSAPSHTSFDQALDYIKKIRPKQALFTHMSHKIKYADLAQRLSTLGIKNVMPSYDGLCVDI